jgi:hypothetical protein
MGWSSDDTAVDGATLTGSAIRDLTGAAEALKAGRLSDAALLTQEARQTLWTLMRRAQSGSTRHVP